MIPVATIHRDQIIAAIYEDARRFWHETGTMRGLCRARCLENMRRLRAIDAPGRAAYAAALQRNQAVRLAAAGLLPTLMAAE